MIWLELEFIASKMMFIIIFIVNFDKFHISFDHQK